MTASSSSSSSSSKPSQKVNLKVEALGGLSAGIIGTVIGYPLDLVKTRMQTSTLTSSPTKAPKAPKAPPKNLFQVGYKILQKEGISSLYKGMTPPLISLSILNTLTFTSYNYIRTHWYNANRGFDIRNFMAGSTIAPMASTISTVEHLIKTQMQLDNVTSKRFRNSFHCLQTLVKESHRGGANANAGAAGAGAGGGGIIRVLYLGHGVNTLREGVFIGTYFYTYEGLRVKLDQLFTKPLHALTTTRSRNHDDDDNDGYIKQKSPPSWTIPFAGGLSGAIAWFVSFPLDCVKAGVQGQSLNNNNNNHKLKGMVVVFQELMKNKGWRGLYAGVTPSIMRAFIVSSSRFTAYEMVVKLCKDYL